MSAATVGYETDSALPLGGPSDTTWSRMMRSGRITIGGGILLLIVALCIGTMPWTLSANSGLSYGRQYEERVRMAPQGNVVGLFGYDTVGRSILSRCLLGGTISLAVGVAAALIAVVLGVTVGLIAGYSGGWVDSSLMRLVDILYGLPYILLVILFKIALEDPITRLFEALQTGWFSSSQAANLVVMFLAIGLVSWLTMARVVRGQVLTIRAMPYIEACRSMGLPKLRIFRQHVLPNLVGPITVYATLTVPSAILQESFLSFLGVGVRPPLPTWGSLASEGVLALSPVKVYWWMLLFPCILLMLTLLCLNFVGDGLRDLFDPKREAAKL
jgi:ABC-type dipeptide/oligopeptide/nickel transport system permease subunit